jgi:hypothetical protein
MWPQCNEELVAAASAPIATALGVGMSELCIDVWVSASWLTAELIDKTGYGSVASVIIWVVGGAGQMEAGRGKLDWRAGNLDWSPRRECTLGFRFDFSVLAAARSVGVLAICIGAGVSEKLIKSRAMDIIGLGAAASLSIEAALGICGTEMSVSWISAGAIDEIGLGGVARTFVATGVGAAASVNSIGTVAIDETGLAVLSAGLSTN